MNLFYLQVISIYILFLFTFYYITYYILILFTWTIITSHWGGWVGQRNVTKRDRVGKKRPFSAWT